MKSRPVFLATRSLVVAGETSKAGVLLMCVPHDKTV